MRDTGQHFQYPATAILEMIIKNIISIRPGQKKQRNKNYTCVFSVKAYIVHLTYFYVLHDKTAKILSDSEIDYKGGNNILMV